MSVLCCHTPHFLLHLAQRAQPDLAGRPLALVGPDDQVCAVSSLARQHGVRLAMTPRQAQMRCPDITLRPLDLPACQAEQSAFQSALRAWQLPVESPTWGVAYVDLHGVADGAGAVQPLAAELGRRLRHALGEPLQPALGWDSSKFTARAAAAVAHPGAMRLVGKSDESRFLAPLGIQLLPLPADALQQLHWLGIRTLGQFAALPASAVRQRFGQPGRTAQQWAQGRDDRPVRDAASIPFDPLVVDLDPPTASLPATVTALMAALSPCLAELGDRLEGCRRLRLEITFLDGETRAADLFSVEPVSRPAHLADLLTARLAALDWPAPAERIEIPYLESDELPAQQLSLFAEPSPPSSGDETQSLRAKYGPVFFTGEIVDTAHPLPEQRIAWAAAR